MEQITELTVNSLNRYYNVLSKLGHVSQSDVKKLLILSHIEDIHTKFASFITQENYDNIIKAVYCLSENSCLIDFPDFKLFNTELYNAQTLLRTSEEEESRVSQNNIWRII